MTSSRWTTIFITVIISLSMCSIIPATGANDTTTGGRDTSTSRTVLGEMFTATWCGPCVDADGGMDIVLDDASYFPDRFVVVEWHSSDNYSIAEESARASMYMVNSIPALILDGDYLNGVSGDNGTPEQNAQRYEEAIDARPTTSSVRVSTETTLDRNGAGHIKVDVEILQDIPLSVSSIVVNAVVVEDEHVKVETGHILRMTARAMPLNTIPLNIKKAGGKETHTADYVADAKWDLDKIGIVTWVQANTLVNKEVFQSDFVKAEPGTVPEGAPVFIGGDMNFSMDEDTADDHLSMQDVFTDPNKDPLNYSVVASPHLQTELDKGSTVVTVVPAKDWFGTETIILKASDGKYTTSATVVVTVDPVEDAPVVVGDLGALSFEEDRTYTTSKSLDSIFSDPDGEMLKYIPTLSSANMEVTLNKDDTLTFVPKQDWSGDADLTVKATDGVSWAEYTTNVEVQSVNDPPRITLVLPVGDPIFMKENEATSFSVEFEDPDTSASSIDVTWKLDRTMQSTTSSIFNYEPDYDSAGVHEITVRLSDGIDETIRNFNVVVEDVNRAPKVTITSPMDREKLTAGIDVYLTAEGEDEDTGDEKVLRYEWSVDGSSIGEGKDIYATLEPGSHEVEVTVTDPAGATARDSIGIVVEEKKQAGPVPFPGAGLVAVAFAVALGLAAISRKRAQ